MQDLIGALEARREEIRHYLKSADDERGGMIKRSDELGENIRRAENDMHRVERALLALTGDDDMKLMPREREIVEGTAHTTMPYFPGG